MAYYRRCRRCKRYYKPKSSYYGYKRQYNYHKRRFNSYQRNKNIFLRPYYSYKARKEYKRMQDMDFLMEGERQKYYDRTGKII